MKKKTKFFSLVMVFSLLLVGFITWGVTSNSFLALYNKKMINEKCILVNDMFFSEYCESGFIEDYTTTNIAFLNVYIDINLKEIRNKYDNYFINDNSFDLKIDLFQDENKTDELNLINTSYVNTECFYYFDEDLNTNLFESTERVFEKNIHSSIFVFDQNLALFENMFIKMNYKFDVTKLIEGYSFKEKVFDKLFNKGITFKVVAEIN